MDKYNQIDRHRKSNASHSTFLASTQSDKARLIYSAAFRRLQQKAQVFSLESNSAVRSRLTHSIEVSHIGRYIIASISEQISASNLTNEIKKYWLDNNLAMSNIVETACLMHDIGNPPFGHFGEAAISQWARSDDAINCLCIATNTDKKKVELTALDDFKYFDGNPQGFRIITKLQGEDGFYGLNLTYTQLAAFIKYTHSPMSKVQQKTSAPFSKKIGFFDTEIDVIKAAWAKLNMPEHSRHPLGFLMEASDDISYCISDIEDGIEKGIIQESQFKKDMLIGIQSLQKSDDPHPIYQKLIESLNPDPDTAIGPFLNFKTYLSNYLVSAVAKKFIDNYQKFITFDIQEEIISKNSTEHKLLSLLKDYTGKYLFTSSEAERMELSGFSIISGILEEYKPLLSLNKKKFIYLVINHFDGIKNNELHIHRRLFNRLPQKHLNAYKTAIIDKSIPELKQTLLSEKGIKNKEEQIEYLANHFQDYLNNTFKEHFDKIDLYKEWNLRTHLIIDFVSGMTDQFSMEFFQMLKGINVK